METHKTTGKGTQLPLLDLKGKPYLRVAHRLVWFREDHPQGRIETKAVSITDTTAIFTASIYILMNTPQGVAPVLLASAHKKETEDNFGDFIEKAETGAVGRALAMAGYGTQFEPELDEGDRLADSPVAVVTKPESTKPVSVASSKKSNRDQIMKALSNAYTVALAKKVITKEGAVDLLKTYGVSKKEELSDEKAQEVLDKLNQLLK